MMFIIIISICAIFTNLQCKNIFSAPNGQVYICLKFYELFMCVVA